VPRPPGPPAGGGRLRPEQQREVAGIGTGSPKEAEFVAGLAEQGAKRDEILRQLERLRRGGGRPGDRNEGLREALQTDSGCARNAAIRDDKEVWDALKGLDTEGRKAMIGQLRAHHLVPMEAVGRFPRVFGPAADAGWRPDAAGNRFCCRPAKRPRVASQRARAPSAVPTTTTRIPLGMMKRSRRLLAFRSS